MFDQLTIASYNIQCLGRGLNGRRKRRKIRDLLHISHLQPDIILLQEERLTLTKCIARTVQMNLLTGAVLWKEGGYSAYDDSYAGGTAIIASYKFAIIAITNSICEHGVIVQGRAQYLTYLNSAFEKVGILNIYGYSYIGPGASLWQKIADFPLSETKWIMMGHCNSIEDLSDKLGGNPTTGKGPRENESWTTLLIQLGLQDKFYMGVFRHMNQKRYIRDNRRQHPHMLANRIDRAYVTSEIQERGGIIGR